MRGGLKKPLAAPAAGSRHPRVERFGNPASKKSRTVEAVSGEVVSHRPLRAAPAAQAVAAPLPSMIASSSHQKLERLLDEALAKADSHKQALRYHAARHFWQRRWFSGPRKWLAIGATVIVLLAAGLYAWRNVPQLSIKAAGLRAHFSATVPGYEPDGYKIAGPAKAVSGAVSVQYESDKDHSKTYGITEQPSAFTSGMVSQNVVPKGSNVQTSQVEGNTVYIYGPGNDAAWVNNGLLYTIKNSSALSSDQLIQIVSGLNP